MAGDSDSPLEFILKHRVFRLDELQAAYREMGRNQKSITELIEYHLGTRRIFRVRRGVYAHADLFDPWLVAGKLAKTVIISHDGALSFHQLAGVGHSLTFMTTERTAVVRYQEVIFQPLRVDRRRIDWSRAEEHQRDGQTLLVTSIEAALVDCLALLEHAPPLDELMEAFKNAKGKVRPRVMIQHAIDHKSPLLCSRLGFFLLCAGYSLDSDQRSRLQGASVKRMTHFQRSQARRGDRAFAPWNLIVPSDLYALLPGES